MSMSKSKRRPSRDQGSPKIEGYSDEKWIEIVHGVDLTLHRGEVMGLIGESGAGKSTIGLRPWASPATAAASRMGRSNSTGWS
jgi:ABC-type polysaccharide/polyol phosphate transport system ATPase subunit